MRKLFFIIILLFPVIAFTQLRSSGGGTGTGTPVYATSPTITTPSFTTGFKIGGAAANGKIPIGDGTNYIASTSTIPTSAGATANKVLLSDGANYVLSTPTFPNASATSGKTIRSDGTNWIASTATLSDAPSTSLKWLRSDGTNWITSTATLAEGAVTSGKILSSDGTNWIATSYVLAGTSGQTYTFPTTTATIARTDAANTFTGTQTFNGAVVLPTGGSSLAPITFTSGTNLATATAGVEEYDGVQFYNTIDATSGRAALPAEQYFHLTANGSAITGIANFFGTTSNINIVANAYYIIDAYMWFVTTGTGTIVFTFTNSAAPTSQNILWEESAAAGAVAPPGSASTTLTGHALNDATATKAITTPSLTAGTHFVHVKFWLKNGTGTTFKIQANNGTATNLTPQIGSWWICRRVSPNNIGTFAN